MTDTSQNINYNDGLREPHKKKKKGRKKWIILISIIAFIIILRLLLPIIVLKYVNKTLGSNEAYPGHVGDIDLAIIRGAYVIKEIQIDKRDTVTGEVDSIPFFTSEAIDLSVEWRALFKGKIVGEIAVETPKVNFVNDKKKKGDEEVKKDTADFKQTIKDLMPITVNRFEINNGEVHYIDRNISPVLDVFISDIQVVAENLSNVNDSDVVLPASLQANGAVYDGTFDLNVRFDAFNKQPTFDVAAELTDVNMVKLNKFFEAYGNFDVHDGKFGLFTEVAAKNGKFKGYVKPIIRDLDVVKLSKDDHNIGKLLWEGVVGTVAEIFENQPKDQLGSKVPLEGNFENTDIGLWTAINYVLRNAFVSALKPSIDNTINLGRVEEVGKEDEDKTFLQKIFGKKDKKKEE